MVHVHFSIKKFHKLQYVNTSEHTQINLKTYDNAINGSQLSIKHDINMDHTLKIGDHSWHFVTKSVKTMNNITAMIQVIQYNNEMNTLKGIEIGLYYR